MKEPASAPAAVYMQLPCASRVADQCHTRRQHCSFDVGLGVSVGVLDWEEERCIISREMSIHRLPTLRASSRSRPKRWCKRRQWLEWEQSDVDPASALLTPSFAPASASKVSAGDCTSATSRSALHCTWPRHRGRRRLLYSWIAHHIDIACRLLHGRSSLSLVTSTAESRWLGSEAGDVGSMCLRHQR